MKKEMLMVIKFFLGYNDKTFKKNCENDSASLKQGERANEQ